MTNNKYLTKIASMLNPIGIMKTIGAVSKAQAPVIKKLTTPQFKNPSLLAQRLKAGNKVIEQGMQP